MRPSVTFYLKTSLIYGLVFSFGMLAFDLIDGHPFDPYQFLFYFFAFGLMMGLASYSFTILRLKDLQIKEIDENTFRTVQERKTKSAVAIESLAKMIRDHPETMGWRPIEGINRLEYITKMCWYSWGERIMIHAEKNNGKWLYVIQSKPRYFLNYIDYGRNIRNVETVLRLIQRKVPIH